MENGLEQATKTGVPQGGSLSVVLSNVYLDKLDKELEQRGLRFTRYADDTMVFTKSEMAATFIQLIRITDDTDIGFYVSRIVSVEENGKWGSISFASPMHVIDIIINHRVEQPGYSLVYSAWQSHIVNLPVNQLSAGSIRQSVDVINRTDMFLTNKTNMLIY